MQATHVVAKRDFRSALLLGVQCGVAMLIIMPICVLSAWCFPGWHISLAELWRIFPKTVFFLVLLLLSLLPAFTSLLFRHSWTFHPDGITVRSWPVNRFISWSDIKYIEVNRLRLTARVSWYDAATLSPVNGPAYWDSIPADKRRRVGLIKWRFWRV